METQIFQIEEEGGGEKQTVSLVVGSEDTNYTIFERLLAFSDGSDDIYPCPQFLSTHRSFSGSPLEILRMHRYLRKQGKRDWIQIRFVRGKLEDERDN